MKKQFPIFILIVLLCFNLSGEKVIKLTELKKPATIIVDGGQILIAEFPVVYIYSQKTLKLETKFGKKGEGPREFSQYIRIQKDPKNPDKIIVGSHMKMSYFTRDGKFLKEVRPKTAGLANVYKPFGDKFVSYGFFQDKKSKTNFQTINLFNSDLKKISELYREPANFQQGRKINALRTWGAWFRIFGEKIFITGERDGVVLVYDKNGNKVSEIKSISKRLKVLDKDKQRFFTFFKTDPQTKNFFEAFKHLIDFPGYFPLIRGMDVVDDKLYLNGYPGKDGKTEFTIFNLEGKVIKKNIFLDLPDATARDLYPYTIKNGMVYQLVDNDEEEVWELHIHDLK